MIKVLQTKSFIKNRYSSFLLLLLVFLISYKGLSASFVVAPNNTAKPRTALSGKLLLPDGRPASYVLVIIKGSEQAVYSENDGSFSFPAVSFGHYTLIFQAVGIKTSEKEVTYNNRYTPFRYTLQLDEQLLDAVEIVRQSVKNKKETEGFAMNVIETGQISLRPIQTTELLDRSVGVKVRSSGGMGSRSSISLNGLSGNAIQVFIDGVPSSNYGSSFGIRSLPTAMIERIEVYKGVVPPHLSSDALGGAINVVLKKQQSNYITASYSIGSFNTHVANIVGNYRKKSSGFTLTGSAYFNHSDNNYEVWGDDITEKNNEGKVVRQNFRAKRFNDKYQDFGGRLSLGFTKVYWADQALLSLVASKGYKGIQNAQTMQRVYGDRHRRTQTILGELSYAKENLFTEGLDFRLQASVSNVWRNNIDTVGYHYDWTGKPIKDENGNPIRDRWHAEVPKSTIIGMQGATDQLDKMLNGSARGQLSYTFLQEHSLHAHWAFEGFRQRSTDSFSPDYINKLNDTRILLKNIFSLSYQWLGLNDKLRLTGFYKLYLQNITIHSPYHDTKKDLLLEEILKHNRLEHGLGFTFSYRVLPYLTLLSSGEKALRLPSPLETFGNTSANLIPAYDLKPERSLNGNLGAQLGTLTFGKHDVKVSTNLFIRDTKDMIRRTVTPANSDFSSFENLESVIAYGFDFEMQYSYAQQLNVQFSISNFNAIFNEKYDKFGSPYLYYGWQIRNEPSWKIGGQISYAPAFPFLAKAPTSLYYSIQYVNPFRRDWANVGGSNLEFIPAQYPMNVGISTTLFNKRFTLAFELSNFLDQQVFDNFGLQKPGRSIQLKCTYYTF